MLSTLRPLLRKARSAHFGHSYGPTSPPEERPVGVFLTTPKHQRKVGEPTEVTEESRQKLREASPSSDDRCHITGQFNEGHNQCAHIMAQTYSELGCYRLGRLVGRPVNVTSVDNTMFSEILCSTANSVELIGYRSELCRS